MQKDEEEIAEKVYPKVLNFLSYRPRTEKEINQRVDRYLKSSKNPPEIITKAKEIVLMRLEQEGFIDDTRFIDTFIENFKTSSKTKSINRLKTDLLKKGVPMQGLEEAISRINPTVELKSAKQDALKKLKSLKNTTSSVRKAKVWKYLLSKGYSPSTIKAVFDTLL